jgi:hypothetical protein
VVFRFIEREIFSKAASHRIEDFASPSAFDGILGHGVRL